MAKIAVVTPDEPLPREAAPGGAGAVRSQSYFDDPAHPLRLRLHHLAADAQLNLASAESDALLYVWKGVVQVQDVRLEERSSMIIERGGSVPVTAAGGDATVLVFGLATQPAPAAASPRVWLLPRDRVPCNWDLSGQGSAGGALHADASRDTPLWLHENDFYLPGFEVAVHSHSEDEIIFVRSGELRLGDRRYGPGAALAIAAGARYGFRVGPGGLSFVNFRAGSPTYTSHDGAQSMDEAAFWRSETGRPEPFERLCERA
jgi:hypothetical protein